MSARLQVRSGDTVSVTAGPGARAVQTAAVFKLAEGAAARQSNAGADAGIDLRSALKAHVDRKHKLHTPRFSTTPWMPPPCRTTTAVCWASGCMGRANPCSDTCRFLVNSPANMPSSTCTGRVAHTINKGQYDEALRMIEVGTPFADVSNVVGLAIRGLRKEAGL